MSTVRPYGVISIQQPSPTNLNTLAPNGLVTVIGTVQADDIEVAALFYRNNETPPQAPTGTLAVFGVPNASAFTLANVPRAQGSVGGPNTDNKLCVWTRKLNTNWQPTPISNIRFQLTPQTNFTVQATSCIWFSYSPATESGPHGEPAPAHGPISVAVPAGASQMTITAQGTWRHDPACPSGPDGIQGKIEQSRADYQHARFRSDGINLLSTELNKLVGLWDVSPTPPSTGNAVNQVIFGAGPTTVAVPSGATRLLLAFHDGYQWNNNSGQADVVINWQ